MENTKQQFAEDVTNLRLSYGISKAEAIEIIEGVSDDNIDAFFEDSNYVNWLVSEAEKGKDSILRGEYTEYTIDEYKKKYGVK
ncbi:MAG: hypothetical protein FWB72_04540 [Firmicutes bacterium]|nr:hypothetical protein [Bacillota bacterium]